MMAEDLVQETFMRVLRRIDSYRYPRPFKAWLYAIATNIARDHYKRADTRHTIAMPEESHMVIEYTRPEEEILNSDEQAQVAARLSNLPDHQREAVIVRYYHEMPLKDIAEILEVPVGTVKSRLSLGLRNLRNLMEDA